MYNFNFRMFLFVSRVFVIILFIYNYCTICIVYLIYLHVSEMYCILLYCIIIVVDMFIFLFDCYTKRYKYIL